MQRQRVDDSVDALCRAIKEAGPQTALEILSALGKLMIESERQADRRE
jgi:hypothetical protein